jgi:hypothetical protein
VQQCGRYCCPAFCVVFEKKEMIEVLKTGKKIAMELKSFFFLFTTGELL